MTVQNPPEPSDPEPVPGETVPGEPAPGEPAPVRDADPGDELESLSTRELHDRAIRRAERHMDLKFMWSLLRTIPSAEVAAGDTGEGEYDAESMKGLIWDAVHSGEGRLGEALRPAFIDYLRRHPGA